MEDRNYILEKMKGRVMTVDEFNYDKLWAPPLYSLLTPGDVDQLHKIATSISYTGKPIEKMNAIDEIMKSRGFRRFGGGTNRLVYKFLEDDSFVVKVASSEVALGDSPREFINQIDLEPFCAKCFEVSPCGTVGVFERIKPIKSREEFLSVADMVYDLITNILIGESVMDDIGSSDFMNYGVRPGFGVVILDYPYRYKLDGNKLYCNNVLPDGSHCGGVIDYDEGFNRLRCTKCGKAYKAMDLRKAIDKSMVLEKGGYTKMKVAIKRGDMIEYTTTDKYLDTTPKVVSKHKGKKSKIGHLKVAIHGRTMEDPDMDEEEQHHINARGTIVHERSENDDPEADSVGLSSEDVDEIVDKLETDMIDDDDESDSDDAYFGDGYIKCSGSIIKSSDLDGDEDNSFKAIIIRDDNQNALSATDGKCYIISELMGKSLDDLSILEKGAYNSLMNELEDTKAQLEKVKAQINTTPKTDNGPEYYKDSKGDYRYKSNHNLYKKPIPEEETLHEKVKELEEDMIGDEIPVGSAPPKHKKDVKHPKYDDEDYYEQNNKSKSSKKKKKR